MEFGELILLVITIKVFNVSKADKNCPQVVPKFEVGGSLAAKPEVGEAYSFAWWYPLVI